MCMPHASCMSRASVDRPMNLLGAQVGMETLRLCQQHVDGIVLVDNAACSAAIRDVFNETRSILEPSGALAVAGASAYLQRHGLQVTHAAACREQRMVAGSLMCTAPMDKFNKTRSILEPSGALAVAGASAYSNGMVSR